MALRVLVFDIDRSGESSHGIAINRAKLVIQPAILFRALGQLLEQTMRMNADTDVTDHRAYRLEVVVGKLFAPRLPVEQHQSSDLTTHDQRHDELASLSSELVAVFAQKDICTRRVSN